MTMTQVALWLTTVASSIAVGWGARTPTPPSAVAPPAVGSTALSASAAAEMPLIAVASDGRVTLRVEQQPLQWVLEQIAAQAGLQEGLASIDRGARARVVKASQETVAAQDECAPSMDPRANVDALELAFDRGSEARRLEALQQAVAHRLPIDERRLRTLYETASSERLRLAAFEAHLESLEDRPGALRDALETAVNLPSAAIQREAARRLAELTAPEGAEVAETSGVP